MEAYVVGKHSPPLLPKLKTFGTTHVQISTGLPVAGHHSRSKKFSRTLKAPEINM